MFMKLKVGIPCMVSGFPREVDENSVLLGYYAASSGNSSPTFRDNLSVSTSRVNNLSVPVSVDPCIWD